VWQRKCSEGEEIGQGRAAIVAVIRAMVALVAMNLKRLRMLAALIGLLTTVPCLAADKAELRDRRARAARVFSDGVLLLHSRNVVDWTSDGHREDAAFYYLTGLENSPGCILAIDGKSRESWLFVPPPASTARQEFQPGVASERKLGVEHVVEWEKLEDFLARQATAGAKLYYKPEVPLLPANLSALKDPRAPGWVQLLQQKWPKAGFREVGVKLDTLLAVESAGEQRDSRVAARATVVAFWAGMRAIRPGVSQRTVELSVVDACWKEARGVSFWPWAMAGINGAFPKPMESFARYDHLDSKMQAGDLVRLDVGCEWEHYQGDLGRTIPVSGKFTEEQQEVWNIFVSAYRATAGEIKEGLTEAQGFEIWKKELLRHRDSAKTSRAQQAIATWSDRKNVPYWQMHTMNLDAGYVEGSLRAGMVIDFEPIAVIGGQGYYLEDMYLVGKDNAEVLTPGLPYTAEEIEAEMAAGH